MSAARRRVTYELSYAPSTAAIESSKIAALESSIDIEKQLGVLDPSCPFSDLQSAVTLLQKRVSLLDDSKKLDSIRTGVDRVSSDIEKALKKKARLICAPSVYPGLPSHLNGRSRLSQGDNHREISDWADASQRAKCELRARAAPKAWRRTWDGM
ncbi:unnamed protein product [Prorocentrum cordatum]|uniref:Uncharacterized protein n=1 Tax=Prorocentrum cordatum TaxID=2364126 RepID=A0ABN9PFJ8_9DINO|nr:unnamed protein product [Polarella glacialis]